MNKYKFLGAYKWSKVVEKEFATDEEALQYRFYPPFVDGRWHQGRNHLTFPLGLV